jgi:hypothetical protein
MLRTLKRAIFQAPRISNLGNLSARSVGSISRDDNTDFGKHCFRGAVAAPYLEKHGLPKDILTTHHWVRSDKVDKVTSNQR